MKRKLIFAAALLLLCTPVMTACTEKKPQESSQTDVPATTEVDRWGSPVVQVDTTENPEDLKAASKVMTKFCNACKKSDRDDVIKYSNVEKLPAFSEVGGYTLTEAEKQQSLDNKINALCSMREYTLSEGKLNVDALRTYAEYMEDFASIGSMLREYGDSTIVDAAEKLFKPIGKIYSFDVTISSGDASNTSKMYVFPDENGEWKVDTGQLQAMVDYMSVSKVKNVNSLAEAASEAVKSSLADMDAEGLRIKTMSGEYHFDEGRLSMIDDSTSPSELDRTLSQKLTANFGEIIDLSHVYFRLDKGEVTALAVQKNFRNIPYYGTWPTAVEEHFMYYFSVIDDAMLFAAGEYDSPAPF